MAFKRLGSHTKALANHIERQSSRPPPIYSLSDDVLSTIFLSLLERVGTTEWKVGIRSPARYIPITLSHVSGRWRDVALNTPLLWSTVQIDIGSTQALKAMEPLVPTWIGRSSPCPIDLYLGLDRVEYGHNDCEALDSIFSALSLSSERMRELHCSFNFDIVSPYVVEFLNTTPSSLKRLRRIVIVDNRRGGDNAIVARWCLTTLTSSALFAAPSLRHLEVDGCWGNIVEAKLGSALPLYESLQQLVFRSQVDISGRRFDEGCALELLRHLPRLSSCELKLDRGSSHPGGGLTELPHLTSLTLESDGIAPGFASHLKLPSLLSLQIRRCQGLWSMEGPLSTDEGTLELLLKFGNQLRDLKIDPELVLASAVPLVLGELKSVESLTFRRNRPFKRTSLETDLSILTCLSTASVCPRLQHLDIQTFNDPALESAMRRLVDRGITKEDHPISPISAEYSRRSNGPWWSSSGSAMEFIEPSGYVEHP